MGVFAGPVEGRDLVASTWTPPEWSADATGSVREEIVWAALDCPTYFAAHPDELLLSFLVRQNVELRSPIPTGTEHVVIAWPTEIDGRKRSGGAAVLSATGEVLAVGEALMVEARQPAS
jgi:acyl-CoA thioesterase FadM